MEVKLKKMSQPVLITVKEDADTFIKRKDKTYNTIRKNLPQLEGFRKGNIPRNIAEKNFDIEQLYKNLIDEIYLQVAAQYNIVSSSDFNFFGDLTNDKSDFTMSFKAELKPDVKLPVIENLDLSYVEPTVDEDAIQNKITADLAKKDKIVDSDKQILHNFDVAVIDFEGILHGEEKPFKGGTAKDYKICINELQNGKHQFIDNFEDQMIGMKIDEERIIDVTFPEDYRDKTKAGKRAKFNVKLNLIKQKVKQELNEEFAIGMGYKSVDDYKEEVKKELFKVKKKNYDDNFKRIVINSIKEKSKFAPIPDAMVNDEIARNWNNYLTRLGKTEKEFLKNNANGKVYFYDNNNDQASETVRITLILENIAKKYNITTNKKEVEEHVNSLSKLLLYDDEKKAAMIEKMATNKEQYKLMENMRLNEKAIDFVVDIFKK